MTIFVVCLVFYILNRDHLRSENQLESLVSRESSFLFNNLVLLGACFAVLCGTLFPILSEWVRDVKMNLGAPFYNKVMVPIGLFLIFLTGGGTVAGLAQHVRGQHQAQLQDTRAMASLLVEIAVGCDADQERRPLLDGHGPDCMSMLALSA